MKNMFAVTVASVFVMGLAGNVAACSSCAACNKDTKVAAPVPAVAAVVEKKQVCDIKKGCGAKKSCAAKKGCDMAAVMAKLNLTPEQAAKIKALKVGCGADAKCDPAKMKACMEQIKSVLTEEQVKQLKKSCKASSCCKKGDAKVVAKPAAE
jgi:Spy/CpxP family protein refolding chaperone